MMNCLINQLDLHLHNAKKFGGDYATRRTYFDQAFGMVLMCCALYPNECKKLERLWEEVYRPKFEEMVFSMTTEVAKGTNPSEWRKNPGNAFI